MQEALTPAQQVLLLQAATVSSWFAHLRTRLKLNADTHRQDLRNVLLFICSLPNPHRTLFFSSFFSFHKGWKHLVSDGQGMFTSPGEP